MSSSSCETSFGGKSPLDDEPGGATSTLASRVSSFTL